VLIQEGGRISNKHQQNPRGIKKIQEAKLNQEDKHENYTKEIKPRQISFKGIHFF